MQNMNLESANCILLIKNVITEVNFPDLFKNFQGRRAHTTRQTWKHPIQVRYHTTCRELSNGAHCYGFFIDEAYGFSILHCLFVVGTVPFLIWNSGRFHCTSNHRGIFFSLSISFKSFMFVSVYFFKK